MNRTNKSKYIDKDISELTSSDFMKGYTHLKNKKRFPIQYKTETEDIKLNEVYKMYAFPKSLVEQCNSSALLFYQNMMKPIEFMKKISK